MNDSVVAGNALSMVSGGPTYDYDWRADTTYGKFVIGFDYDKTSGTATTMRAVGSNCKNKDPDGGRRLDANRVAPNDTGAAPENREWLY